MLEYEKISFKLIFRRKGRNKMKFDIKGRIKTFAEQIRYSISGLLDKMDENAIRLELGDNGYDKIYSAIEHGRKITEQDFEEIKSSYLNAQKDKVISPSFWSDSLYFENYTDAEFKEYVEQAQLGEGLIYQTVSVDDVIVNLLNGANTEIYFDGNGKEVKVKGTKLEERQTVLRKMVETYVKEGYNIYPLMRKINESYNELSRISKDHKNENVDRNKVICLKSQMMMERMEAVSPYRTIFRVAENLGQLIEEEKEMRKQENYDASDELQEKIDKQRELLTRKIESSGFDMDELTCIADSKRKYIQESEQGFNYQSSNYAMYTGLFEVKKCIHNLSRQKERQAQI